MERNGRGQQKLINERADLEGIVGLKDGHVDMVYILSVRNISPEGLLVDFATVYTPTGS